MHIDHGNLILGGQSNICLFIAGKSYAYRLIKTGCFCSGVDILNRCQNVQIKRAGRIGVDHTHRVGYVIRYPDFLPIRFQGQPDRVNPHVNPCDNAKIAHLNHINRILTGIDHKYVTVMQQDRASMWAQKIRVTDLTMFRHGWLMLF